VSTLADFPALKMEATLSFETSVLERPTCQKTAFFIVAAVTTSDPKKASYC
jgi:hypothetical protein